MAVTRGSGTSASRADLGISPTRQNLLEAIRLKTKGFDLSRGGGVPTLGNHLV
jgi:hypothetical protein